MNIVMAMNMGGDEFIEKPFDLNVVTAKVQAILRRSYSFQGTMNVMEIWVDRETGVNYVFHAGGYAGGMTPLLDREGKPVISPVVNR